MALGWVGTACAQADAPEYLDQGWSTADRTMFYTTSQGSQMMPYDWFLALERPGSEMLFLADGLARFGYLPNPDKTNNPDGLPVGFVKDVGDNGDWVGMTCSACHTNQVRFAGKTLQIDGAPTDADMWGLINELGAALAETSDSDAKFGRFAGRIRARAATAAQPDVLLRKNLKGFSDYFTRFVSSSRSDVPWGRARLDAFGMIFNRATAIDLNDWSNAHPPNAPVSYPFLWDTHWHDLVQWNGSAPNRLAVEQLARNVGEVLGVFARTEIRETILPPLFFKSSAKRVNQILLEQKLAALRSPAWPEQLVPIDAAKAAAGAALYTKLGCETCHALAPRDQPLELIDVTMTPVDKVGTDPLMAVNAKNLMSKSGILEGVQMPFLLSDPIPANPPSFELTGKIVIGAILAPPDWMTVPDEVSGANQRLLDRIRIGQPPLDGPAALLARSKIDIGAASDLWKNANNLFDKKVANTNKLAYKARPLDGIWATAPYLHNGSVPNLYQLLLPAKDRMKRFFVGTRDFDPVNVGFVTDGREGAFEFDTSLPGNSNVGHDTYGTDALTEEERRQLVEYLKTL
ncbi:MAG TPA: di-heme-cytochrome C peroxidase [Xanthobacteraceae bacterium]|nr:di-heme-cytochrome C peroxidase [Xanthobacteraceae bacterium]